MKSRKLILTIVFFGIFLVPIFGYVYYYFSIKKTNLDHYENWFNNDYFNDEFIGVVVANKRIDDKTYVVTIDVKNGNEKTYNFCQEKMIFNIGDTILKKKKSFDLYKIQMRNEILIKYNFCKE